MRAGSAGRVLSWLAGLLAIAIAGAAAFVWSGLYDISANRQHTQPVYSLLEFTMRKSVQLRAARLQVPPLDSEQQLARGSACYLQKCAQCHGGPGFAQSEIGRSMQPLPGPLVDASGRWTPAELYWITRNGIKMSGMPAWGHRMHDDDVWAVVAFMQRLPRLTAAEFRQAARAADTALPCAQSALSAPSAPSALSAGSAGAAAPAASAGMAASAASVGAALPAADARRGRDATTQYACNACHRIPGVTGSDVAVGPPLAGFADRRLIAGAVNNDADQLVRWIRNPQSIDPETTMPNMQVSERDARDIAAYLLTLH